MPKDGKPRVQILDKFITPASPEMVKLIKKMSEYKRALKQVDFQKRQLQSERELLHHQYNSVVPQNPYMAANPLLLQQSNQYMD